MHRILTLALISFSFNSTALKAQESSSNNQILKINRSYKEYCTKKLFPLDTKKKLSPDLIKLEEEILSYSEKHDIELEEAEIKSAWKIYLTNNFRSKEQLEQFLENQEISLETLQKRFYKKLVFEKYYEFFVKPKLLADLRRREKAIELLTKSNTKINSKKILETIYKYEANAGGKVYFENYLRSYSLNKSDLVFYIKSDIAKKLLAAEIFDTRIKEDASFQKQIKERIEEAYINAKNNADKQPKDYYFRQFYINKKSESALEQISYLKNILRKNPNYKINRDFFEGLTLFDMVVPANNKQEFYSQQITNSVTRLEQPGDISSIIESDHGYHIVQLKKIDSKVHDSLEEAYPQIYSEIKNKYISSLEENI